MCVCVCVCELALLRGPDAVVSLIPIYSTGRLSDDVIQVCVLAVIDLLEGDALCPLPLCDFEELVHVGGEWGGGGDEGRLGPVTELVSHVGHLSHSAVGKGEANAEREKHTHTNIRRIINQIKNT